MRSHPPSVSVRSSTSNAQRPLHRGRQPSEPIPPVGLVGLLFLIETPIWIYGARFEHMLALVSAPRLT